MEPRYNNYCKECEYLGQYEEFDLYYCSQGGLPTVIARYGEEEKYISGMNFATKDGEPALYEALKRKQRQYKLERVTKKPMKTLEQLKEINLNELTIEQLTDLKNDVLLLEKEDATKYVDYVADCVDIDENFDVVFDNHTEFIRLPEIAAIAREKHGHAIGKSQTIEENRESIKESIVELKNLSEKITSMQESENFEEQDEDIKTSFEDLKATINTLKTKYKI